MNKKFYHVLAAMLLMFAAALQAQVINDGVLVSWNDVPSTGTVTIPAGVHTIGANAFWNKSINTLEIPAGVTTIDEKAFMLTTIQDYVVAADNQHFAVEGGDLYTKDKTTLIRLHMNWRTAVADLVIPASVTKINPYAFQMPPYNFATIAVAEGNTAYCVEGNVLYNADKSKLCYYHKNNSATTFELPASVTQIEPCALAATARITDYSVAAGNTAYTAVDGVLYNASKTALIRFPSAKRAILNETFAMPAETERIGDFGFYNQMGFSSDIYLSQIKEVGAYAFTIGDRIAITNIHFPNVTGIGEGAFGIPSLRNIHLPKLAGHIPSKAFTGCTSISIIDLHLSAIASVATDAFQATAITRVGVGMAKNCIYVSSEAQKALFPEGFIHPVKAVSFPAQPAITFTVPENMPTSSNDNLLIGFSLGAPSGVIAIDYTGEGHPILLATNATDQIAVGTDNSLTPFETIRFRFQFRDVKDNPTYKIYGENINFLNAPMLFCKNFDFSRCTDLKYCRMRMPSDVTTLDFTSFSQLHLLSIEYSTKEGGGSLQSLDLSQNSVLKRLELSNNSLTDERMNAVKIPSSVELLCINGNGFTHLNLSALTSLKYLYADYCKGITTLATSQIPAGTILLSLNNCAIADAQVADFTQLRTLNINYNKLTELNVTALTNLEKLDVSGNEELTRINACSGNSALHTLYIHTTALDACALNSLYTALPERTAEAPGKLYVRNGDNNASLPAGYLTAKTITAELKEWQPKATWGNDPLPTSDESNDCVLTSVPTTTGQGKLQLYPNPASSHVVVSLPGGIATDILSLYNATGKCVLKKQVHSNETIDITRLPNGIYLVKTAEGASKLVKHQ